MKLLKPSPFQTLLELETNFEFSIILENEV